MLKIVEILDSWITAHNPSEEALARAKYRISICNGCEFKVQITNIFMKSLITEGDLLPEFKCGLCGCPLSKLVFSPKLPKEICHKHKWDI